MALTVIESRKGAKNKHPTSLCRCDCGRERVVRTDRLKRGEINSCATCARADGAKRGALARSLPPDIALNREVRGVYIGNARKKGIDFNLSEDEVAKLIRSSCHYCGILPSPTNGIDRLDSAIGYFVENVVPCCSTCNYAKRDMSPEEFINWIQRVYAHQSVLQRDRHLLLRLAEQSDGRRPDHTGGN